MASTKKTRFSEQVDSKEVSHVEDISFHQRRAVWFSKIEYAQMQSDADHIVRSMKNGTVDKETCIRGLENRITKATDPQRFRVLDVTCAVLAEQTRQVANGELDVERLRATSLHASLTGQMEALKRGDSDAREVGREGLVDEITKESILPLSKATRTMEQTSPKKKPSAKSTRLKRFLDRAAGRR
jgi:hypothetical protein